MAKQTAQVMLIGVIGWSPWACADDKPMNLRQWMRPSVILSMEISPDGKWLAGIGYTGSSAAFLKSVETSRLSLIAEPEKDDRYVNGSQPIAVHWLSSDLLAVDYDTLESYSMDLKGKRVVKLGERFIRSLAQTGPMADWVLVYRDWKNREIDAVNARTGDRRKYRIDLPGRLSSWAFDELGSLRAVRMTHTDRRAERTKVSNWYRVDEQSPWQLMEEGPITEDHWVPMAVLPESDRMAVWSRQGRDTYAIFKYNTRTHQHEELMAGHPLEDILDVEGLDKPAFDKVITHGLRPQVSWFDPTWSALQNAIDVALPGRINSLSGNKNGQVLIFSYGDVDPGHWFVLDTKTFKLREVGESRPSIDPKQMRPTETLRYTARDGLSIPAYLTRPATAEGDLAPMVVLIHGGPQARDTWGWDQEVQLLVSQGYTVFQPQFRGSSGFGRRFEEAGYQQWGRAMQDDITDGVQYLIDKKVADPKRICIYGAGFGGYAALWGTIRTPEMYQCAVSFAGVSDLLEMLSNSLFDDSTAASREIRRLRIGDPAAAKQMLDEVSPVKHAAKVSVPLFIAHGEDDTRVLPSQSRQMVRALEALGKPVQWMPIRGEGHGLTLVSNQTDYYQALLKFLRQHLGETKASNTNSTAKEPTGPAQAP